jgi:hypothetical protein
MFNMEEERKVLRAMKRVTQCSTLLHFTTAARIPSNRFTCICRTVWGTKQEFTMHGWKQMCQDFPESTVPGNSTQ